MSAVDPRFGAEPIAIVGMGCRFPGSPDLPALWRTVRDGRVWTAPVPADRWPHELFYSPTGARDASKTYSNRLAVVDGVRDFAPEFFGLTPRRAKVMDPQQRLFLDVVRAAVEDAGYGAGPLSGSTERDARRLPHRTTGVFVGATVSDFMDILTTRVKASLLGAGEFGRGVAGAEAAAELTRDLSPLQAYSLVGTLMNMVAADVSQCFDFGGPSFTMDAACSSALVALHEAVLHLRAGLCDAAVVGGVYLILAPDNIVAFARIGALSPSDTCRPFDRRADGFVIGEGIGAVVLRRLSDAVAAGDRIYAVIRGVGMNNDGKAEGPMTPRKEGQVDALARAYDQAGFSPRTVELVEAHGTATPVGDATEIAALGHHRGGPGARPCAVSSIKANIGHSMSAAGVAGLIRAALSVHRRTITPHAGYAEARPELQLADSGFIVPQALTAWDNPVDHPRRAGVNSFGFGGTNVHVVLEEAPAPSESARSSVAVPAAAPAYPGANAEEADLFLLSAPNDELLASYAGSLRQAILDAPETGSCEIAAALAGRRTDAVRVAFVAAGRDEVVATLARIERGETGDDLHRSVGESESGALPAPTVAFMYPGQGAQAPDLCRDLYERFPAFRAALDELTNAVEPRSETDKPLLDYLYPRNGSRPSAMAALTRTEICQPVMAALGLALTRFLEGLGVVPKLVVGHSLGEFVAAAAAGLLDPADTVRLVGARGRLIAGLPLTDRGAMAAVAANRGVVEATLAGLDEVVVANANHPQQTVISGTSRAVEAAVGTLGARGIKTTALRVSHAFHSPLMAGLRDRLRPHIEGLRFLGAKLPLISATRPGVFPDDEAAIREHLLDHATASVDFVAALNAARAEASDGPLVFLQMGGGRALVTMARLTLGQHATDPDSPPAPEAFTLAIDEPDGGRTFLTALARLWALGAPLRAELLYAERSGRPVVLPASPLETRSLWPVKRESNEGVISATLQTLAAANDVVAETAPSRAAFDGSPVPPKLAPAMSTLPPSSRAPYAFPPTEGDEAGTPAGSRDELAALFAQQMAVLDAQVEIIRQQNELLARGGRGVAAVARGERGDNDRAAGPALAALPSLVPHTPRHSESSNGHTVASTRAWTPAPPRASVEPTADVADAGVTPQLIEERIIVALARITASPAERLRGTTRLGKDLGFDSLMVVELASQLAEEFPGLGVLPKSLFARDLSVTELAKHVAETIAGPRNGLAARAPQGRFAVHEVALAPSPLLAAGAEPALRDASISIVAPRDERARAVAEAVARELRARLPATAQVAIVADAGRVVAGAVIVDLGALTTSLDGAAARSALLARLERAQALATHRPAFWLLVDGEGALDGGPGLARALAQEWSGTVMRAVSVADDLRPELVARFIADELLSGDGRPEVHYRSDGTRLAPVIAETARAPRRGAELSRGVAGVITGGAHGIGAKLARALAAAFGARVLLLGRRAGSARTQALVAELRAAGGDALYLACDVRDPDAVSAAVAQAVAAWGPLRFAVHAAGVTNDASIEKKDLARAAEVFDTKVNGALALWTALAEQPLSSLLLLGSWAGRVGNAQQSDYAAANHGLTQLASHLAGQRAGVRVAVLDLPPWQGSGMVEAMPEAVRRALATQVTFLDDEQGLPLLMAELQETSAGGAEALVAVQVPEPPAAVHSVGRFGGDATPYAADHRIGGRLVMPLATAISDTLPPARALLGLTQQTALVLESIEVVEGLLLSEAQAAAGAGTVATVTSGRDESAAHFEVWGFPAEAGEGSARPVLAFQGRVRPFAPGDAFGALGLPPDATAPPPDVLASFYERHTFHGPTLQVLEEVESLGRDHAVGVVRAAALSGARPLVAALDGALQLAALWSVAQHGVGGLPLALGSLTLAREPRAEERLRCVARLRAAAGESDGASLTGDFDLLDDQGHLVAALRGFRGQQRPIGRVVNGRNGHAHHGNGAHANGNGKPAAPAPRAEVATELYRPAEFPEVRELEQRLGMAAAMGISNPYFRSFDGVNADTASMAGRKLINFSSYNYVGLSGHPDVNRAVVDAVKRYGTSVSASRVASGQRPLHDELEREIARFVGAEAAFVMVGGHATNVSVIGHLLGPEDLVVHDSLAHDSILGGVRLSGAKRRPFAHNDPEALERILSESRAGVRRVLVAVEGVYSMDGDIAPLDRFIEIKRRYGALLFVDEAHSLGVLGKTGRGVGEHFGINPHDVDLWMGTMSKTLASCGGYIAGSEALVNYLRYTVPGFIYSVGISPPNAAAALAALRLMEQKPELTRELQRKAKLFLELCRAQGIDTGMSEGSAVIPCIVGNSYACLQLAQALEARGINVQPILYPAVEENMARLRFFVSVTHTEEQLRFTADVLGEEFARVMGRPAPRSGGRPPVQPEART